MQACVLSDDEASPQSWALNTKGLVTSNLSISFSIELSMDVNSLIMEQATHDKDQSDDSQVGAQVLLVLDEQLLA